MCYIGNQHRGKTQGNLIYAQHFRASTCSLHVHQVHVGKRKWMETMVKSIETMQKLGQNWNVDDIYGSTSVPQWTEGDPLQLQAALDQPRRR